MKSEQEIRKKLNEKSVWTKNWENPSIMPKWYKEHQEEITKLWQNTMEMGFKDALNWTLEGEPRYSVEELEKIFNTCPIAFGLGTNTFITFLKNPEKVKTILEKD